MELGEIIAKNIAKNSKKTTRGGGGREWGDVCYLENICGAGQT